MALLGSQLERVFVTGDIVHINMIRMTRRTDFWKNKTNFNSFTNSAKQLSILTEILYFKVKTQTSAFIELILTIFPSCSLNLKLETSALPKNL